MNLNYSHITNTMTTTYFEDLSVRSKWDLLRHMTVINKFCSCL